MTKNEFVSRVLNGLNSLNKDQRISRRYVLEVGRNIVKDILSKHHRDGTLLKDLNIVTEIPCLEMISDSTIDCCIAEFKRCHSLMVSKCELPELVVGTTVLDVSSIDNMIEFKPTNLKQFRRNLERNGGEEYYEYYIENNRLYLPNSHVKRVNLTLLTLYPEDVKTCGSEDNCVDIWDSEFIVPGFYLENVVKSTIQEVAFKKQIVTDENPNLDGQT